MHTKELSRWQSLRPGGGFRRAGAAANETMGNFRKG
jgi:hypothetical protein